MPGPFLGAWNGGADVGLALGILGGAYLTGWARIRVRGYPALASRWRLAAYLAGLAAIGLALLSPVETLASVSVTAHMVEHELLTMAAAPLVLLGNPLPVVPWALPRPLRRGVAGLLSRKAAGRCGLAALTRMPVAWLLFMGVVWGWHLPAAYAAGPRHDGLHDLQHLSFFVAAVLFWWPLIQPAPRLRAAAHPGLQILYVIAALMSHTLAAMPLALLAQDVLYPYYASTPRLWGLTALQDQAGGFVLMGFWQGLTYLGAVLPLLARLLQHEEPGTGRRAVGSVLREGNQA